MDMLTSPSPRWPSSQMGRRDLLRLLAMAGVASFLPACRTKEGEPPLKIGYLPITDATPLLIGCSQQFFQNQGLTVEKPVLMRGWAEIAEAFLAGTFNVVHLLLPVPIYMRFSQNHKVKVVAWNHTNGSALTMASNRKISDFAELGGKQIAVPYWYSIHNILLQLGLRKAGIEVVIQDRNKPLKSNQTNLFVMKPPDMPTALSTGAIDGYIVAEPFDAAGEVLAKASIVRFTGDIFRNHPCCVVVMKEEIIQQHPQWAQKVVNGLVEAQKWVISNRVETAHILSKDGAGYLPLPDTIINRALNKYDLETYGVAHGTGAIRHPDWHESRVGFEPYPYESATRLIVQLMKETKVEGDASFLKTLNEDTVVRDLFDYDMVKLAANRVGGLAQFEGVNPSSPYTRVEEIEF
jgi:NitT/TauT family transport system substrate-binding protein